jgi:hypothetical protein
MTGDRDEPQGAAFCTEDNRGEILDDLVLRFRALSEGASRAEMVVLRGRMGTGKTRIVQELYRRLATEFQGDPPVWPPSLTPEADSLLRHSGDPVAALSLARKATKLSRSGIANKGKVPWLWLGLDCDWDRNDGGELIDMERGIKQWVPSAFFEEYKIDGKGGGEVVVSEILQAGGATLPGGGLVIWAVKQAWGFLRKRGKFKRLVAREEGVLAWDIDEGRGAAAWSAIAAASARHPDLPVVLVIEDAHFADRATLDLLAMILSADFRAEIQERVEEFLGGLDPDDEEAMKLRKHFESGISLNARVLVVAMEWPEDTSAVGKPDAPADTDTEETVNSFRELVEALAETEGSEGTLAVSTIDVAPLSTGALTEIATNLLPEVSAEDRRVLAESCDGNPLLLGLYVEIARSKYIYCNQKIADPAAWRELLAKLPREIDQVFAVIWALLGKETRDVLAVATIQGNEFDPQILLDVIAEEQFKQFFGGPELVREALTDADPDWVRALEGVTGYLEYAENVRRQLAEKQLSEDPRQEQLEIAALRCLLDRYRSDEWKEYSPAARALLLRPLIRLASKLDPVAITGPFEDWVTIGDAALAALTGRDVATPRSELLELAWESFARAEVDAKYWTSLDGGLSHTAKHFGRRLHFVMEPGRTKQSRLDLRVAHLQDLQAEGTFTGLTPNGGVPPDELLALAAVTVQVGNIADAKRLAGSFDMENVPPATVDVALLRVEFFHSFPIKDYGACNASYHAALNVIDGSSDVVQKLDALKSLSNRFPSTQGHFEAVLQRSIEQCGTVADLNVRLGGLSVARRTNSMQPSDAVQATLDAAIEKLIEDAETRADPVLRLSVVELAAEREWLNRDEAEALLRKALETARLLGAGEVATAGIRLCRHLSGVASPEAKREALKLAQETLLVSQVGETPELRRARTNATLALFKLQKEAGDHDANELLLREVLEPLRDATRTEAGSGAEPSEWDFLFATRELRQLLHQQGRTDEHVQLTREVVAASRLSGLHRARACEEMITALEWCGPQAMDRALLDEIAELEDELLLTFAGRVPLRRFSAICERSRRDVSRASRALADLVGKEPSEFAGRPFAELDLSSEWLYYEPPNGSRSGVLSDDAWLRLTAADIVKAASSEPYSFWRERAVAGVLDAIELLTDHGSAIYPDGFELGSLQRSCQGLACLDLQAREESVELFRKLHGAIGLWHGSTTEARILDSARTVSESRDRALRLNNQGLWQESRGESHTTNRVQTGPERRTEEDVLELIEGLKARYDKKLFATAVGSAWYLDDDDKSVDGRRAALLKQLAQLAAEAGDLYDYVLVIGALADLMEDGPLDSIESALELRLSVVDLVRTRETRDFEYCAHWLTSLCRKGSTELRLSPSSEVANALAASVVDAVREWTAFEDLEKVASFAAFELEKVCLQLFDAPDSSVSPSAKLELARLVSAKMRELLMSEFGPIGALAAADAQYKARRQRISSGGLAPEISLVEPNAGEELVEMCVSPGIELDTVRRIAVSVQTRRKDLGQDPGIFTILAAMEARAESEGWTESGARDGGWDHTVNIIAGIRERECVELASEALETWALEPSAELSDSPDGAIIALASELLGVIKMASAVSSESATDLGTGIPTTRFAPSSLVMKEVTMRFLKFEEEPDGRFDRPRATLALLEELRKGLRAEMGAEAEEEALGGFTDGVRGWYRDKQRESPARQALDTPPTTWLVETLEDLFLDPALTPVGLTALLDIYDPWFLVKTTDPRGAYATTAKLVTLVTFLTQRGQDMLEPLATAEARVAGEGWEAVTLVVLASRLTALHPRAMSSTEDATERNQTRLEDGHKLDGREFFGTLTAEGLLREVNQAIAQAHNAMSEDLGRESVYGIFRLLAAAWEVVRSVSDRSRGRPWVSLRETIESLASALIEVASKAAKSKQLGIQRAALLAVLGSDPAIQKGELIFSVTMRPELQPRPAPQTVALAWTGLHALLVQEDLDQGFRQSLIRGAIKHGYVDDPDHCITEEAFSALTHACELYADGTDVRAGVQSPLSLTELKHSIAARDQVAFLGLACGYLTDAEYKLSCEQLIDAISSAIELEESQPRVSGDWLHKDVFGVTGFSLWFGGSRQAGTISRRLARKPALQALVRKCERQLQDKKLSRAAIAQMQTELDHLRLELGALLAKDGESREESLEGVTMAQDALQAMGEWSDDPKVQRKLDELLIEVLELTGEPDHLEEAQRLRRENAFPNS